METDTLEVTINLGTPQTQARAIQVLIESNAPGKKALVRALYVPASAQEEAFLVVLSEEHAKWFLPASFVEYRGQMLRVWHASNTYARAMYGLPIT